MPPPLQQIARFMVQHRLPDVCKKCYLGRNVLDIMAEAVAEAIRLEQSGCIQALQLAEDLEGARALVAARWKGGEEPLAPRDDCSP